MSNKIHKISRERQIVKLCKLSTRKYKRLANPYGISKHRENRMMNERIHFELKCIKGRPNKRFKASETARFNISYR